jgi:hypothetical protein
MSRACRGKLIALPLEGCLHSPEKVSGCGESALIMKSSLLLIVPQCNFERELSRGAIKRRGKYQSVDGSIRDSS